MCGPPAEPFQRTVKPYRLKTVFTISIREYDRGFWSFPMKKIFAIAVCAALVQVLVPGAVGQAGAKADTNPYANMAPLDQYLIADQDAEVALAKSGAPPSISDEAEVMVLGRTGFRTAVEGKNGFVCVVERGWGAGTDAAEFWNPKIKAPICFNAAAARSFLPIFLMKTKLAVAGKSKAEILAATNAAFEKKELPALEPGAMCYMLSKQQYLNDVGKSWHPHLMFFVSGDAAKSWGADEAGSPVMAANDPEERATIMMVWAAHWSDGTAVE
jgi:hypothetical protein